MYQARPHGKHSPGVERSEEDQAAAELLVRRLTNIKNASGVESLKMVRSLPSGAIAIAQDAGGVLRLIIQDPIAPPEDPDFDGVATDNIPMLFSGVMLKGTTWPNQGLPMNITEQTRRRIAKYEAKNLPPKRLELMRFVIKYNPRVSEFDPEVASEIIYTQYAAQRPTWYSGAMAEVMQVVGGYGRQEFDKLPDLPLERARMVLPEKVARKIRLEMVNLRLPGYTGMPDKKGEFQYDYKFNDTNCVGFDDKGKPWLLRIYTRGVYAMPLPLVPATTTNAFREYMTEVGDEEILWILDRFGGMPTGESFPVRENDFESWRRAGVIIKVCDCADFYDHIMYSSATGWSVNESGNEGFNTCYDYDDAEGLGYGLAYKLKLQLGSAINNGKLPKNFDLDDPRKAAELDAYLSGLYQQMSAGTAKNLAVKYKLRRVPVSQVIARFGNKGSAEVDYWDNLELDPIAVHSGSVTEVGRGWLYHGAKFMYQPQIKFPEPYESGCVSHNFLPLINGRYKEKYPKCDTIMFGYYIGDQLKVAKYFRDDATFTREVEDDYDECMTVGSWTRTITAGSHTLFGHLYTSDFDEREFAPDSKTVIETVGTDLGYDHTPWFAFDAPFWMPGTMWRNRYFKHEEKTVQSEGFSKSTALCIPYLSRNSILHADKQSTSGGQTKESTAVHYIRDPYSYRFWTYDFIVHWAGSLEVMTGKPYPKKANPVWVEIENYNPSACSDFADNGPWVEGLPADYTWLIHPQENVYMQSGGGGAPTVQPKLVIVNDDGKEDANLEISILDYTNKVHKEPSNMYFLGSPTEFGDIFYRDTVKITAGNAEYASVSETDSNTGLRKKYGKTELADHKSAHHFIGVINE